MGGATTTSLLIAPPNSEGQHALACPWQDCILSSIFTDLLSITKANITRWYPKGNPNYIHQRHYRTPLPNVPPALPPFHAHHSSLYSHAASCTLFGDFERAIHMPTAEDGISSRRWRRWLKFIQRFQFYAVIIGQSQDAQNNSVDDNLLYKEEDSYSTCYPNNDEEDYLLSNEDIYKENWLLEYSYQKIGEKKGRVPTTLIKGGPIRPYTSGMRDEDAAKAQKQKAYQK